MNCFAVFFDALTGVGTLALAFFTYKSVDQSKHMAAAAKESIDLTRKIEKSKIKPYCTISPLSENSEKVLFGTCPEAYFSNSHDGPTLSCVVKNHGPGAAHAVSLMLCGDDKKLWTKRIRVADILAPGDQISFQRQFAKSDLPSSEVREYRRSNGSSRVEGQPEYLCTNIKYIAVEYQDSEQYTFHAVRLFVPRAALNHPVPAIEPTDAEKFATESVEMLYFDGPHENKPYYSETEDQKDARLGEFTEGKA
ncbi:hypothetical protein [Thiomonas sp.]